MESTTMFPNTTEYDYDYSTDSSITPCSLDPAETLGVSFRPALLWAVCVVGVLGNGLVLWVLARHRVRTMADVCLLNLALADLLLALLLPLWTRTGAGTDESTSVGTDESTGAGTEVANAAFCKFTAGMYQLGFTSGLLFVTLMSLDRYLAIVHAVASSAVRKLRYSVLVSGAAWAAAVALAAVKALFTVSEEGKCLVRYPTPARRLAHNLAEVGVCLGVCLPVLTFCYVRILVVVRQQRSSRRSRAVRLIFAIVAVFSVFWVPYYAVVLLQTLHRDLGLWSWCQMSQHLALALEVTETVTLTHCCVNPVIYAFVGEKFKKGLAQAWARRPLCAKLCPQAYSVTHTYSKPSDNDTSNTGVSSARLD
ncbi:C-C chemokine receptor type 5-like [Sardina pilchardus]|uniref:C-C chemokine receptor type 5-like n=1 Tax=Sardina pilchardus TaxID=27697 RepID=UPI002E16243B